MARSARLFEIIQILRAASAPVVARDLSAMLEVSIRTIYRDVASLQAMQTPIDGAPGVGYVLRKGYDLPPVNFDVDEAEAVALGLQMIARTGDSGLWRAAGRAARKLHAVAPSTRHLIASGWGADPVMGGDLTGLRTAIREERKVRISYVDADDQSSDRVIWPLVLVFYADRLLVAAWCELRQNLRHFRLDRVVHCVTLDEDFRGRGAELLRDWEMSRKGDMITARAM